MDARINYRDNILMFLYRRVFNFVMQMFRLLNVVVQNILILAQFRKEKSVMKTTKLLVRILPSLMRNFFHFMT